MKVHSPQMPGLARATGLTALTVAAAFASWSARADSDSQYLDKMVVSAPTSRVVGHDADQLAIVDRTDKVRVMVDPVTLTTNSGVALLRDSVAEAAYKACAAADPLAADNTACIRRAIESARPRIGSLVARARAVAAENANG